MVIYKRRHYQSQEGLIVDYDELSLSRNSTARVMFIHIFIE